jgi:hypothetical protein
MGVMFAESSYICKRVACARHSVQSELMRKMKTELKFSDTSRRRKKRMQQCQFSKSRYSVGLSLQQGYASLFFASRRPRL